MVVCTTSGTAAAELHPAVLEADLSRVPLVVCTADRPPELHHVGAPQTIEQTRLFGPAVRWFAEPGVATSAASHTWRSLGARAVAEAARGPNGPGPVHLNLAFADPLVAEAGPLPAGRPGPGPVSEVRGRVSVSAGELEATAARWAGRRGLLVAGEGSPPAADVLALAHALGWPVLADPRSGCRVDDRAVVAAADSLARSDAVRRTLVPEVVVALGAPWASKALADLVAEAAADGCRGPRRRPLVAVAGPRAHRDRDAPSRPGGLGAIDAAPTWATRAAPEWSAAWQAAEQAAQSAIDEVLDTARPGRRAE